MTKNRSASDGTSLLEQQENATFRSQRLAAVPSDLLTMQNLTVIDLSHNRITRFPGELFVQRLPHLEVLHLQHNLLYVLEDILALSVAPRLRELNVSSNPLRLIDNRIYFLEALFSSTGCTTKALRMVQKDPTLTAQALSQPFSFAELARTQSVNTHAQSITRLVRATVLMHRLPRRTGFPMLQKLNAQWITDNDVYAVERERGRAVEYFTTHRNLHATSILNSNRNRNVPACHTETGNNVSSGRANESVDGRRFDGSRMTAKELLKKTSRSASIPSATVLQRFQIDVESNGIIDADSNNDFSDDTPEVGGEDTCEVIHRLFAPGGNQNPLSGATDDASPRRSSERQADGNGLDGSSWKYPIRSFDTLASDERQYIRHRSKQSVESNLQRNDHFFDSSVYLDCVAQAERSRRLTIRAVDVLCPLPQPTGPHLVSSFSAPTLHATAAPVSIAASQLRNALASKFSKVTDDAAYEKLEAFLRKPPAEVASSVNDKVMQAALGELFLTEHVVQRHQVRQLIAAHDSENTTGSNPLDVVAAQLDDSLSRTKLRNAVDLANAMMLNKKQEKRMMQMLIDADTKAIEQERAGLEQALHRHRLDLIASNTFYMDEKTAHESDRAWMAKAAKHTTVRTLV